MSANERRRNATKFGALAMAAVALGCAAIAAMMVGRILTAKGYTGTRVRSVVVAKANLPAARIVSRADLEVRDWPEDAVPTGAFSSVDDMFASDDSPVPSTGILAGEPVVLSRLSTTKAGSGVARLIKPNLRAVALRVDDAIGQTGLVYPGAFVDVIVTVRDPMGRGPSSRIAVQHARVLTVGTDTDVATRRTVDEPSNNARGTGIGGRTYITLEVTPQEAEVLSIARNEGKLNLALRNGEDDATVDTPGATPRQFSAFTDESTQVSQADSSTAKRSKKSRSRKSRRRATQVVASERPDAPSSKSRSNKGRIEMYHAR